MILLISEVFPPMRGGSGRWLWELYRRLPPGSVSVAASAIPGADAFDRTHPLPVTRVPLRFSHWGVFNRRGGWEYARAVRTLARIVRRHRPDVLHCGKCLPEGFLAWALRRWGGPPYWCYVHGEELTLARTSKELAWLTRRTLHGADGLVANSRHTRDMLARDWAVPAGRVHVLHPGVDTGAFTPAGRDPAARARLGWGDRPVVLTVGALQQRKGQDTMIRALPRILREVPDLLYVTAGEGWERPYLEGLVADLGLRGAVQFRGAPDDRELITCYQQCDLFALPNRQVGWDFEGFGIVLLEAQASGRPVLAGASGGTVETMSVPDTGVVIDCSAPDLLAETVPALLASPERLARMGQRARAWAVERFDWSVLIPQACRLFGVEASAPAGRYTDPPAGGARFAVGGPGACLAELARSGP